MSRFCQSRCLRIEKVVWTRVVWSRPRAHGCSPRPEEEDRPARSRSPSGVVASDRARRGNRHKKSSSGPSLSSILAKVAGSSGHRALVRLASFCKVVLFLTFFLLALATRDLQVPKILRYSGGLWLEYNVLRLSFQGHIREEGSHSVVACGFPLPLWDARFCRPGRLAELLCKEIVDH